ncbi:GGDEF domain-containing protein [Deinococcus sp. KSM4-11]|uniref:GGDEF domain-containing protein n=1 Tax=Deinococcus sp. KSM4-11 TaxID=2568654 RepID=UPI0010A329F8|nr:GGDEF domain-containing protein [Deinococcus sp. KSM4-11]THF83917.1 GGDEF domain-containing protein [Deinococcus sp. KSM4-11]
MPDTPSPLEQRLQQIRIWIVVVANLAYLLYTVLTTVVGPDAFHWGDLLHGVHRTRYWGGFLTLGGLLAVWAWPARVREIYLPYVATLLLVSVAEVVSVVASRTMPFHLALWLSANMAIVFLVYGARGGLRAFALIMVVILAALVYTAPITGNLLADWLTTLIVMTVSGASSYLLMTLIENNMLVNERTIEELRTARIDLVTGVPGRAITEQALERSLQSALASGQPLSVIISDIDHFKSVNDQHGHKRGDEVLRAFAARIERQVPHGQVGRWGGEEFLILLPGYAYATARDLAEALCRSVKAEAVAGISITASFGVSCLTDDMATTESLFTAADSALYAAKRSGRNQVA